MMYKNEKNKAAVKILLSINPKFFQAVHYIKGFDFTKPFDIVSGDGKFTLNSIKKECEYAGVDTADTVAILMMEMLKNSCFRKNLYVVNIYRHKFVQFEDRDTPYNYNLDNFYSIGRFEEARKKNTKRWFVIIQRKEYLTEIKKEKKIDFSERMMREKSKYDFKVKQGNQIFSRYGIEKQIGGKYEISRNLEQYIDKSGYFLYFRQSELKYKAKVLKSQRQAAKAATYDCTAQTEKIKDYINNIKKVLSDMILNDEYKTVDHVMWSYCRLCNGYRQHDSKIKNNQYRSVEQIIDSLSEMEKLYTKIVTAIETDKKTREVS